VSDQPEVFADIGRYYDGLVARYGHSHLACDYGRSESQRRKFAVLSEVLPLSGKSVLDVGCGFADYASYLQQHCTAVEYHGVDLSPAMVAAAQKLHPDLAIRRLNILEEDPGTYDVVTANGIFYLLGTEAPALMRSLITRMFALAREAVAFNSLSSWAADPQSGEYYADPAETMDFCRTMTPWVILRHDYHPRDFTVYMYRAART